LDSDTDQHDDLERSSDNELIEAARRESGARADRFLGVLYRRHYRRVAYWCLKISGNREDAADLAQDVFLRVHARLDSFRLESAFSTWLYTVTRSVAINRGKAAQRRPLKFAIEPDGLEAVDPSPDAAETLGHNEILEQVRSVMEQELDPLEAKVLYLHHADGMTLPAITRLLALDNKSGAKAYIVSGMRKLKRHLGRDAGGNASSSERS
jgi:RNA polymerase sigma-70 factor (ECF subfamily)